MSSFYGALLSHTCLQTGCSSLCSELLLTKQNFLPKSLKGNLSLQPWYISSSSLPQYRNQISRQLTIQREWQGRKHKKLVLKGMSHMLASSVTSTMSGCLQPYGCSPPVSSVHGILQARILECVAIPSSTGSNSRIPPTQGSFPLKDRTQVLISPSLAGRFFTASTTWGCHEPQASRNKVVGLYLPPGPLLCMYTSSRYRSA